ncbi:aminoglycoside phosphotransferase family protein [Paracoccus sp. S1E-3]|uniref:aminoglycoside phosphotransferase family protein n=1 Tax=Paracoccus sp. S1E-3 TaxID=2756130 RepID=UPI0015EF4A71|nr:aminoglycoside phosphotransferase family protein [Paracoccus sp. S1E-3]MBA4489291.1 APH(6) family putative aminoglycoside O-phosphotransferase [Paracoccus sp. S1E-3]
MASPDGLNEFSPYLLRWNLIPDGEPLATPTACLLPVRQEGRAAMLKLSSTADQQRGAALMAWWNGEGAARVKAMENGALLMERAEGTRSLGNMSRSGDDDNACRILCATAAKLHRARAQQAPPLVPLTRWFRELEPAAARYGGILGRSAETAGQLLTDPLDCGVLHGDLHHDNVLDFGRHGWLAIDPHGLVGERGFDFANIFTNPDLSDPEHPVAADPARFLRRLEVVAEHARLERRRLLQWILAWTGLSAAWFLEDNDPLARIDLSVAELAAAELDR